MSVPPLLNTNGEGKVYVDIGLDAGAEFFAALKAGYSVYGIEANPISAMKLKEKCEKEMTNCKFVYGSNITAPLPPIHRGGYLIFAGAGAEKGTMKMSLAGPDSSFAERPPHRKHPEVREVSILPLSAIADVDVFLMKVDVQGFEFEVLKGAKQLFDEKVVKSMLMEVYPRGLGNAGVNFHEFLNFLWNDLGLICSSSLPLNNMAFDISHPSTLPQFAAYLQDLSDQVKNVANWGKFDDFFCFNRRKVWKWQEVGTDTA